MDRMCGLDVDRFPAKRISLCSEQVIYMYYVCYVSWLLSVIMLVAFNTLLWCTIMLR